MLTSGKGDCHVGATTPSLLQEADVPAGKVLSQAGVLQTLGPTEIEQQPVVASKVPAQRTDQFRVRQPPVRQFQLSILLTFHETLGQGGAGINNAEIFRPTDALPGSRSIRHPCCSKPQGETRVQ